MDKMLRDKRMIALFVLPGLVVFSLVFVAPLLSTAVYSLTDWNGVNAMRFVGLGNYIRMFTDDPIFLTGVRNTLIFLGFSLVGQIPVALVLALLMSRFTAGLKFFKTAFFIPVLLSTAAIALLWQKVYEPNFGIVNQVAKLLGSGWAQEWLSGKNTVVLALAAPIVWQFIGYHMVILYAGIKSIPEQYYEAALLDGADGLKATWLITIPLLRDIIKVSVVLCAVGSLKLFDLIYIMTKGGPHNSSVTVALQMYNEAFLKMSYGYGSAIAIFLVVECLVVAFLLNKVLDSGDMQY